MLARAAALGLTLALWSGAPALALTPQQKMDTCKFGADDQKLQGAKRKDFLAKCMAKGDAPAKAGGQKKSK
jgi:hypothetical protein